MNTALLQVWGVWDILYQHLTRLEYVDKKNGNIFRVVFCKYHGPKLITRDGQEILNGDFIVKLHIHNVKLTNSLRGINSEARLGLMTLKIVKESLPMLAQYVDGHPKGKNVTAIIGTTFLHRGVNKLGFDVEFVPDSLKFRIKNFYLRALLVLIHPNGMDRLRRKKNELTLKRVYMSIDELQKRYGNNCDLEEKI